MIETLWAILALCSISLTAAAVLLLNSLRKSSDKLGLSLDSVNKELPAILNSPRLGAEDAEALLSFGKKIGKTTAWAAALLKGFRAAAGLFDSAKGTKD